MRARTIASQQEWQSPDGQKTIWAVTLEADGKTFMLKTYSPKIAQVGWEGQVESYENNRGQKFVKQPQQQGGWGGGRGAGQPKDEAAIKAMWAIGQAVQSATLRPDDTGYESEVEDLARIYYSMVDRVKGGETGGQS
jgi:hypothetical protein